MDTFSMSWLVTWSVRIIPRGDTLRVTFCSFFPLALAVATILLTAAADSSSPLGRSTSVMPRYLRVKSMPSSSVSRVSVQFSGSLRCRPPPPSSA